MKLNIFLCLLAIYLSSVNSLLIFFCPFFCLDVLLGRTLSIKHGHPLIGRKTLNFEAPTGRVRALGTGTEEPKVFV